jgi:hypothetical protein
VSALKKLYPDLRAICFGSALPSKELPIDDWIEFHYSPAQDAIKDIYAQCDAWITASRSEGFNLPAMEAMACRTPVVATRTGWPEEAVVTGKNGMLVDIDDINGLVRGAEYILNMPDDEWRQMSYHAYETVASSSWDTSAMLFEAALKNACARGDSGEYGDDVKTMTEAPYKLVDSPVFLVGSMRSGTTLLRLMLDHHPQIAFNLESEFLVTRISDDRVLPDIEDYCEFLRNDRIFQHSRFEIKDGLDYVSLVKDFLEQKRTRDGKMMVGATIHEQFAKIDRIWPNAKYIYILRDGRDVARSVVQQGLAGNAYMAADWWLQAETEWLSYRETLTDGSWIELRFKDFITDPVKELTRICRFLGVVYSNAMFDYVKNSSYGKPDASLSLQWKSKMSEKMLQCVENKIGDRLLFRGYELSGYPRITLSDFEKKYLRLHSKFVAFIWRICKYGATLVIGEIVTRRLGLKEQHRRISRMMDKILDANLK